MPWATDSVLDDTEVAFQSKTKRGIVLPPVQPEPVARTAAQSLGVGIAELDLDVLVIGFHRSRTDPKLFGDPIRSEAGANEPEDVQLEIGQIARVSICSRVFV